MSGLVGKCPQSPGSETCVIPVSVSKLQLPLFLQEEGKWGFPKLPPLFSYLFLNIHTRHGLFPFKVLLLLLEVTQVSLLLLLCYEFTGDHAEG